MATSTIPDGKEFFLSFVSSGRMERKGLRVKWSQSFRLRKREMHFGDLFDGRARCIDFGPRQNRC